MRERGGRSLAFLSQRCRMPFFQVLFSMQFANSILAWSTSSSIAVLPLIPIGGRRLTSHRIRCRFQVVIPSPSLDGDAYRIVLGRFCSSGLVRRVRLQALNLPRALKQRIYMSMQGQVITTFVAAFCSVVTSTHCLMTSLSE